MRFCGRYLHSDDDFTLPKICTDNYDMYIHVNSLHSLLEIRNRRADVPRRVSDEAECTFHFNGVLIARKVGDRADPTKKPSCIVIHKISVI